MAAVSEGSARFDASASSLRVGSSGLASGTGAPLTCANAVAGLGSGGSDAVSKVGASGGSGTCAVSSRTGAAPEPGCATRSGLASVGAGSDAAADGTVSAGRPAKR
jgi:hypothetical protein